LAGASDVILEVEIVGSDAESVETERLGTGIVGCEAGISDLRGYTAVEDCGCYIGSSW